MFQDKVPKSEHFQHSSGSPATQASRPNTSATSSDKVHRCSYCGESFQRSQTKHMPFCSRRCQQIDLGMWLNESYGLPYEGEGVAEGDLPE